MSLPSQKTSTLTPDQSRAARRELAVSQKELIAETGVQAYKLKQFEAGNFRPDIATLKRLRDFYESKGVNFDEIDAHLSASASATPGPDLASKPGYTNQPRPGFFISNDLPEAVVERLLAEMEASDDRIADLIKTSVKSGLMGGMTDKTESDIRELFGHLAANHLRFRCLQGRNIIAPTRDEAKTVGDHLSQWAQEKSLACVVPDSDDSETTDTTEAQTAEQE
jgi:transcriptional regulator with XRE-family HTH domain